MSHKKTVYGWIDGSTRTIIELETLLTALPAMAPESGGNGELEKAEALTAWLIKRGITGIERFDAPDTRVSDGIRPNIVATIKGRESGRRLWIMSHLDVVPEGDRELWKTNPWEAVVDGDKIFGRGTEDNQQGIVSSIVAALALLDNGIVPPHDIKLLFVADEECGSDYGIKWLLRKCGLFAADDLIVIPDGGSPDGSNIEIAEKHVCWIKISTKGKQCHASTPDVGANAFLANCELALRINALERESFPARDPLFDPDRTTLTPTKKEANVPNVNTIPGDDVFYVDMRIMPRYPIEAVLAAIQGIITEINGKYHTSSTFEIVNRSESPPTPMDTPVVPLLSAAVKEVYGVKAKVIGIGGGTVGAHLRKDGFDCVVWSRQNETAHIPNEYALISNISGDAKVFAGLMLREQGDTA